jgi:hypothetical protein
MLTEVYEIWQTHPMGEHKHKQKTAVARATDSMVVDTLGGRMHVHWDESAQATPNVQLVFFAEFLACTGVFDRWVENCPLSYTSPNAPGKRDVLGTLLLAILAGHRRYAYITAPRGFEACQGCCGAVGYGRPMGHSIALYLPAHRTTHPSKTVAHSSRRYGVTAGFRIKAFMTDKTPMAALGLLPI